MITNPDIVAALTHLAAQHHGILRPADIVEAARDPSSPLHHAFTWDDSEAAHHYRLWQARQLVRVVVRYQPLSPEKTVPVRVFVSLSPDRKDDGGGYRVVTDVLGDEGARQQMLADARDELQRIRVKYAHLQELVRVFRAIDDVIGDASPDTTEERFGTHAQ